MLKVVDLLTRRPVVNAVLVRDELGIRTDHPRRYLGPLTDAGILVEFTDRARNRAWRAPVGAVVGMIVAPARGTGVTRSRRTVYMS